MQSPNKKKKRRKPSVGTLEQRLGYFKFNASGSNTTGDSSGGVPAALFNSSDEIIISTKNSVGADQRDERLKRLDELRRERDEKVEKIKRRHKKKEANGDHPLHKLPESKSGEIDRISPRRNRAVLPRTLSNGISPSIIKARKEFTATSTASPGTIRRREEEIKELLRAFSFRTTKAHWEGMIHFYSILHRLI